MKPNCFTPPSSCGNALPKANDHNIFTLGESTQRNSQGEIDKIKLPRNVRSWCAIIALLAGMIALFNVEVSAQPGLPCNAVRWTDGDHWAGIGCSISETGTPKGIVACGNAASTQSGIDDNTVYTPANFTISGLTSCLDPDDLLPVTVTAPFSGQKISWFNFDVRPSAGTYQFQTIATGNYELNWALYYSLVPTCSTSGGSNLSGDCSMLSATPLSCGIDFNGWSLQPFVTPDFTQPLNVYLVVWKRGATNSSNDDFDYTFKARYGCGDFCSLFSAGAPVVTCLPDGSYTVVQNIDGTSTTVSVSAPGSTSIVTSPNPLTFTSADALPAVNSGTVTVTYPAGVNYNITMTPSGTGYYCNPLIITGPAACCFVPLADAGPPTANVCSGSTFTTAATAVNGTILWTTSGNGTFNNATLEDPTYTPSAADLIAGTVTLTMTVTGSSWCPIASDNIILTFLPAPTCTISGANEVCAFSTANIYSASAGMSAYAWTISGNGTIIGSTTMQNVTVTAGGAGSFTLTSTITDANGCASTCMKTVIVNPAPTCSITGVDAVCSNSIDNVFSAPAAMSSYAWSITGNGTIVGSTSQQNVTVTATTPGSFTLTLVLTDGSNCSSTCMKTVTVNAYPVCNITGSTSVCPGSTNQHCSQNTAGSYSWTVSAGGTISGSSTGQCVNIIASGTCGTSYTVTLTLISNGCTTVCTQLVNVSDTTPPTITTGSIADCYATVALAEAAALAATSATDNCGGTIIEAASTSGTCIAVVTVTETDGCGNQSFTTYNTRIDNTDPVFAACPVAPINLGCNAPTPNAAAAIAAAGSVTDACGPLASLTASAPAATQTNCDFSQTWTVLAVDQCGNDATCQVTFIWRVDITDPVFAACPVAAINLGCNPTLLPTSASAIADAGSVSDACGPLVSVTATAPITNQSGCDFNQAWTVVAVDQCGNSASCEVQYIWRIDEVAPVCATQNITVSIDPMSGSVSITPSQVNENSSDNCGPVTLAVSPSTFTCSEAGQNIVTLTVTDQCSNTSTCTAIVTVEGCAPSWTLTKTSTTVPNNYDMVGDILTYSLSLVNTGDVSISAVSVTDPLATTGPTYQSGDTDTDNVLDVGETWIYTATHNVTQADINAGSFLNTATATGTPITGDLPPAIDTETILAVQNPNWVLVKTSTLMPNNYDMAGDVITYLITLQNTGNVSISTVSVADPQATTGPLYASGDTDMDLILDVGETWTYNATHTVVQADVDAGFFTNTATATGTPAGGILPPAMDSETVLALTSPSITVLKTGTPNFGGDGIPQAGETISYAFAVTNTGNVTLTNVIVTDPLVTVSGGPLASLAPGATDNSTFTATYILTQADINAGTFTNTATAIGTPPTGPNVTDTDDDTQLLNQQPSILLTKTGTLNQSIVPPNGNANAGDQITYVFTVTNTGNVTLTNVTITDPLVTMMGGPITSLAPGASNSTTFTATYTLLQSDIDAGTFTNIATATGTPPIGAAVTDTDDDTQPLNAAPSIELLKTGTLNNAIVAPTDISNVGDQITYVFTVTNAGNVTLTNITINDPLVPVMGGPILSLAPGASDNITFTGVHVLTQADLDAFTFTNTATVTGTPPFGSPVMDTDDDTQPLNVVGSIELLKVGTPNFGLDGVPQAGETITYVFTVTNTGVVTLTNVIVTDPLVTVMGGPIPTLLAGEIDNTTFTATYVLTQANINSGTFNNIATVTGNQPDGEPVDDTDDDTQTLPQISSINLTKTGTYVDNAPIGIYNAGDQVTYTFGVTNTGNVTLSNVTVTDPLVTVAGGPILSLAPGATDNTTFTATYLLTQADINAGTFTNIATATGTPPSLLNVTDTDDDTQNFLLTPSITLAKTGTYVDNAPIGIYNAGDQITYTFTVTNTGNVTLTNVFLTDPLVAVSGGPIASMAPGAVDNTTFTGSHILLQADIDKGTFTNVATATGTPPSGANINDTDDDMQNFTQIPSINVVKTSVTVPNIYDMVGDVLNYTITLANTGNITVYNPMISDPGADAPGPQYVSGDTDNDNVLDVGETWNYTAVHTATQQNVDYGSYTNVATGTGSGDTDGDGSGGDPGDTPLTDNDNETILAVQSAGINVVKTSTTDPNNYDMAGDVLTYAITLANTGNITVYNPTMSDPGADAIPGVVRIADQIGDNDGILEVGEIWVYTAQHTVTQQNLDNGSYTNLATGTGSADTDGNGIGDTPLTDNDPETINALQNPSIDVVKTSTTVPNNYDAVGDVLTYAIMMTNNGNVTVYNPTMSDPTATTGPTYSSGDAGVLGVLEVGETWIYTATHTVTQQDLDKGNYTNTATGTGMGDTNGDGIGNAPVMDSDPENINALQNPSINVVKTSTTLPNNYDMVGDILTYSITLTNNGNLTVYNPTMSDPTATTGPTYVSGDAGVLGVLEVGETWTYTATHTVTQQDIDNGNYTNLATGNGFADTDGNGLGDTPVTDNDPETIMAVQTPSINVVKTSTTMPNNYDMVGDVLTYNITLTNNGNVTVHNPTMSDPTATTGPTYVSGDAFVIGILEVGETWTFTATHTVTQQDLDNGNYTNTATGNGLADTNGDNNGDTPVTDNDPETILAIQTPGINVVKTSTTVPNNYDMVGDMLTYSITLTNNGNVTVYNPTMSDPTATNGPTYVSGDAGIVGVLEAGETWTYTAMHSVTQQDLDNGFYTNLATGNGSADTNGDGIGDTPVTDNDPEIILAIQAPGINVVKTSTTMPNSYSMLGDILTYAITLANTGNITVYNPTMSDPGADAPGPVYVSGDTDNDNILDVGETWNYTAQHTVVQLDLTNGNYLNTATGTGSGDTNGDGMGDTPLSDSDTETVSGLFADLSLLKTVSNSTPNVGDAVTFTITVSNAGPGTATGVTVGDVIPNGYTYVPGSIMGGATQNDGGVPTLGWTIASISSGGSAVLTFQATVLAPGAGVFYLNHAEVTDSDQYDPDSQPDPTPDEDAPAQDDEETESVMPQVADLSLTKTVNDNTPDQGQNITYTIIVSNSGPANATGVEVTDLLPAGLSYVSSVPSQGSYNDMTGLWTVGGILNAGSATLTIVATVTGSGIITNYAEITDVDQYDPDSDPNVSFNTDDYTDAIPDDDEASVPITVNCGDCDVINGPINPICPGTVSVFNAQINGLCDSPIYTWTVTGNYTSFTPNGSSITVTTGSICNQPYTVSVSIECDNCGTSPIVCSDIVLVQDFVPPMWDVDACNNIGMEIVAANANCEATMPDLRADALTQLTENCSVLTIDDIIQVPTQGSPLSPPVGFDGCGPTGPIVYTIDVTFNVVDDCGNAAAELSCAGLVKIEDTTAPTWSTTACENIGIEIVEADANCATVMPDLRSDALAQLTENCEVLTVADIIQVPAPGSTLTPPMGFDGCGPTGPVVYTVDVTFNVSDCNGNAAVQLACEDLVQVQDVTAPTWNINACTNIGMHIVNADANCDAVMPDLRADALTQLTENCDVLTVTDIIQVPAPGTPLTPPMGFDGCGPTGYEVYAVDVTFNVMDCNGNAAVQLVCDDLVKVQDVTPPTWNAGACANMGLHIVNADANCDAIMPDLRADALLQLTENCDMLTVNDIDQFPAPGSYLSSPVGFDGCGPTGAEVYGVDVLFNVTDCNGNAAIQLACEDLVKVQDVTPPTWDANSCTNIGIHIVNANADCEALMPDLRADALLELTENCDVLMVADIIQFPAPGAPLTPPAGFDGCGPTGAVVYAVDVTFNVTDCNGNAALPLSCAGLVKVQDVTPPTWSVAACDNIGMEIVNADANCEALMPDLRGEALLELTENCDVLTVADIIQFPAPGAPLTPPAGFDGCGPTGAVVYAVDVTFNVTDCNGNVALPLSCAGLVKVQDVIPPTWSVAACDNIGMEIVNADANCEALMPDLRGDALLELTENCDMLTAEDIIQFPAPGFILTPPIGFTGCGPDAPIAYIIDVTFNVTDCNGNLATPLNCAGLVKVQDITPPTITCPLNVTIACTASTDPSNTGSGTATDNCTEVTITYTDASTQNADNILGTCDDYTYMITRTWKATDACGNMSTCTQVINVEDILAPVITYCPANVTIACTASTSPNDNGGPATATDNCSGVTITSSDVSTQNTDLILGTCDDYTYTITRTWKATDACGNMSTCTQMINVQDILAPVITCPAIALTLECDADGDFTIIGNLLIADWLASATATDACSDAIVTHNYSPTGFSDGCGATGVQIVTFTATDACSNTSTCTAVIQIVDTTPPTIDCSSVTDLVMECVDGVDYPAQIEAWIAAAKLTILADPQTDDACDVSLAISDNYNGTDIPVLSCDLTSGLTVIFTVTDECGNTATCVKTVYIDDTTVPTIDCSSVTDLVMECVDGVDYPAQIEAWIAAAKLTILADLQTDDACDVSLAISDNYNGTDIPMLSCDLSSGLVVVFTVTDECGNTATCAKTVYLDDSVAPTIDCSGVTDLVMECVDGVDYPAQIEAWIAAAKLTILADPQTDDACDITLAIIDNYNGSDIPVLSCDLSSGLVVMFTVTDECGNTATCAKTVFLDDTTLPVITCPADTLTLECDADGDFSGTSNILIAHWLATAIATDACSGAFVTHNYSPTGYSDGCGETGTQTVTFTATDSCGNTSTCQAVIEIKDTTVPDLTCPVNITVDCNASTAPSMTGMATASDNCDVSPEVTYSDVTIGGACPQEFTITRTWLATDICGNTSTCAQLIIVDDRTAPVITLCPANVTIDCTDDPSVESNGFASATDNCSDPEVDYSDVTIDGECGPNYIIQRTWLATDDCGNTATCLQVISIEDNTPPVCATQDISITEIIDPVTGVVHFTAEMINNGSYDACGGPVTLSVFPDSLACEDEGPNIVTLTVTDECGNTSTCTAIVTIDCIDPCVKVASWIYLEGAATDPNGLPNSYTIPMRTTLNDLQVLPGQTLVDPFFGNKYTPPGQPYSVAPWNYPGLEGNLFDSGGDPMMGDAGYPPTAVDWVLVSLREDSAGTGGPVCMASALLHNDGHIEFVEQFDCCDIDLYATYYIVIEHRNHLIVMSHDSLPVDLNNSTITYDFRLQQSYLNDPFGFGAFAQKEIQGGVFAMFAGNGDQTTSLQSDTDINFDDRTFWEGENGDIGAYRFGDYNLNTDTNFNDRLTWERNNGNFTSVPRD